MSFTYSAPIVRWRAPYRQHLLDNIVYTQVDDSIETIDGIPKLTGPWSMNVLNKMRTNETGRVGTTVSSNVEAHTEVYFSQTAGNFISISLVKPMYYNVQSYDEEVSTTFETINAVSMPKKYAVLAALAGEVFYWYWLVWSDEFHVTKNLVAKYVAHLDYVSEEYIAQLIRIGKMLDGNRREYLVF